MKRKPDLTKTSREILANNAAALYDAQVAFVHETDGEKRAQLQENIDILTQMTADSRTLIVTLDEAFPKKEKSEIASDVAKVAIPAVATVAAAFIGYLGVRALVSYEEDGQIVRTKNAATLALRKAS
jgi:hypothetical protein